MPMIVYPGWIWVNAICIFLLGFIDLSLRGHRLNEKSSIGIFRWALRITAFALLCDALSRLYTYSQFDEFYGLFTFMMYFKYALIPIPSVLFLEFMARVTGREDSEWVTRGRIVTVALCVGIAALLVVASHTQLTFWFDERHVYHRGPFFFAQMIAIVTVPAVAEAFVLLHRHEVPPHKMRMLATLGVLPIIGGLIQSFSYGGPSMLVCMTLAYVITYVSIISDDSSEDFLTRCISRERFDKLLSALVENEANRPFALVMADLDFFKDINDTYGHAMGDRALVDFSSLLKRSVRMGDVVCRQGGDEFLVLLYRCGQEGLDSVMERIEHDLDFLNRGSDAPYHLQASFGSVVVDADSEIGQGELVRLVDARMYEQKRANRSRRATGA